MRAGWFGCGVVVVVVSKSGCAKTAINTSSTGKMAGRGCRSDGESGRRLTTQETG